jgi:beta-lactamase regulating signal transducer with metallopeptidase domain
MESLLHATGLASATAASALFAAIWQGTILALCVALCLRLLPRLSAATRSLIWMNVFLLLVLLHFGPSFMQHGAAGASLGVSPLHSFFPIHLAMRWSIAIAGIWAALSLWRGVQLVLSAIQLHALAMRAMPFHADPALEELLTDKRRSGRSSHRAELCTSSEVERPCVFGFFHPRILIPQALIEKLSPLELQQVVTHEMEHLRRADDWTNLFQKLVLVLFPLNPALLWVERKLCAERELACDDRVLRSSGARRAYAVCLTRLAEYSILHRSLTLVLGAWEHQSELVRRVHRLLRIPHEPMSNRQARLVTAVLLAGVLGAAFGLARSPQLVGFSNPIPQEPPSVLARSVQPTAFHNLSLRPTEGSPRMVEVKAVMPQRPAQSRESTKLVRRSAARSFVNPQPAESRQQGWVVLTDWRDSGMPGRPVIAVNLDTRTAYAAVPTPNGWLIVQI